jgi:hypothetical protein
MPFSENLDEFINADTPGYVLATVAGLPVPALFDNAYLEEMNVVSRNPFIHVKESDVLTTPVGASVVIGSTNYKTAAPYEADGHGFAIFQLMKA